MTDKNHSNSHYDVIIIGAGAAGLAAAIGSSRRGLSCLIIDKNKKAGNKLYATGNGHCNLTNEFYSSECYFGNSFADELIGRGMRDFAVRLMSDLGVSCTSRRGYIYPSSMQASTVVWALKDAVLMSGGSIVQGKEAIDISYDDLYTVKCSDGTLYTSDALILAAGSPSTPELGVTDTASFIALTGGLGIKISSFEPCLCPVRCNENLSSVAGVRCDARVRIVGDKGAAVSPYEEGELQIADYGLSGIVIFNQSFFAEKGRFISVDLLRDVSYDSFLQSFKALRTMYPDRKLMAFTNGYINDKLALYHLKALGLEGLKVGEASEKNIEMLYERLSNWRLEIEEVFGFERSQASKGGISTDMVDIDTMAVRSCNELYAAGECLDVVGKCGGYNISFALYTGYTAGCSALKDKNI